jgi:hypothetical protein
MLETSALERTQLAADRARTIATAAAASCSTAHARALQLERDSVRARQRLDAVAVSTAACMDRTRRRLAWRADGGTIRAPRLDA